MLPRFLSLIAALLLSVNFASAQTVRFDTTVGTFDMVLNPTLNENLTQHVDNMLAYVNSNRYNRTVINRAPDGFVMQMGGFQAPFLSVPENFNDFPSVPAFDPVIVDENNDGQVDFDTTGLTNTRGTVTLALSNSPNTGTSSFFVNLGDNSFLDEQGFVPFARIDNMATINLIMNLPKVAIPGGGLASDDIPTIDETRLIIIEQAYVVSARSSLTIPGVDEPGDPVLPPPDDPGLPPEDPELPPDDPSTPDPNDPLNFVNGNDPPPQGEMSVGVPEPSGLALSLCAAMLAAGVRRRRS